MTIGTTTSDLRVWHPPEGYGTYLTGLYSFRNWSGADYPKTPWKSYIFLPKVNRRGVVTYQKRKLWARPPKRARVVEHPYQCTWEKFSNPRVALRLDHQGSFAWGGFHELFPPGVFPRRWQASDDYDLFSRLRTKVAGSTFNAAVSLAELPEALEFIAGAAKRINTALGAVKKKQVKQAINILTGGKQRVLPKTENIPKASTLAKRASQGVLSWNYAVMPTLLDVKDAAEYLAQQLNFPLQETYRVNKLVRYASPSGLDQNIRPDRSWVILQKSIIARIKEVNVPQLVGLTDPLSVLWEKTLLSFVADWFIPIGDWLDARGLNQALEGTYVVSLKEEFGWTGAHSVNPALELIGAEGWSYSTGVFTRTISDHLSVPALAFKPLSSIPSWRKATNAIALLVSAHGSSRGHR